MQREREELLNTGTNTTTSSWEKTGFYPFNPNPESWINVLSTLGKLNKEMKKDDEGKVKEDKTIEIIVNNRININKQLTEEEKEVLIVGMHSATTPTEAAYFHMHRMLARWREQIDMIPPLVQTASDGDSVSTITNDSIATSDVSKKTSLSSVTLSHNTFIN